MRRSWIALTIAFAVLLLIYDWWGRPSHWWEERFLISTFSAIHHGDDIPARMADLADLGFNALESNTPLEYRAADLTPEEHLAVLDACKRHGMRYFVTDHKRLTGIADPTASAIESLVDDYGGSRALGGYFVWDEPPLAAFEPVKRASDLLSAEDDRHLPMVGVVPSYGPYQWPLAYPEFAKTFVKIVDPQVIAFDHYGIRKGKTPGALVVSPDLYRDLDLWSDLALRHHKPLWFYAAAVSWADMAAPTLATLRFQASAAMAYGAHGVIWFMARDYSGGAVDFTGGALTADGKRGPLYDALKEVNHWMTEVGPTALKLRRQGVAFSNPVPPQAEAFSTGFANLAAVSGNLLIAEHSPADGRRASFESYLWVVSRDLQQPTAAELRFSCPARLMSIPMEAARNAVSGSAAKQRIHLGPGEGKLLQVLLDPSCVRSDRSEQRR